MQVSQDSLHSTCHSARRHRHNHRPSPFFSGGLASSETLPSLLLSLHLPTSSALKVNAHSPLAKAIHDPGSANENHRMDNEDTTNETSADVYGRREECFHDFQDKPFRFQDCVEGIQLLSDPVDAQGLILQPGLQTARLPNPSIGPDTFDCEDTNTRALEYCGSPEKCTGEFSPFFSITALLEDLQLPLELIELDSNPADDMREYLNTVYARSSCDPFEQWLPLSPTRDDKDEGLLFPPKLGRLRSLLLRELDCESISITQEALALEWEAQASEFVGRDFSSIRSSKIGVREVL